MGKEQKQSRQKPTQQLIRELAQDKSSLYRQWPYTYRCSLWFLVNLFFVLLITYGVQGFRQNFVQDLWQAPLLSAELMIGLTLSYLSGLYVFKRSIPGEKFQQKNFTPILLIFTILGVLILAAFFTPPKSTPYNGARSFCEFEILFYGLTSMVSLFFFNRLGFTQQLNKWERISIAFSVGMVPASVMQLACMFDPTHSLLFHYSPVILLVLLGNFLISIKFFKN